MASASVASKVPFIELAGLLNKINATQGTDRKKSILKEFIDKWRSFHEKMHGNDANTNDSFYPVMRLLLPQLERERVAYGIKEHTLAKLYIEVLGLGKDSPAANKLLHYKAPKNAKADAGDFASVAFFVLQHRCPDKGTLTVADVNHHLDEIAANNAVKTKDVVKKSLQMLLRNMSATEQKWLIRMIMKELKVGLSQQSVFSIFHEDAESLFNVSNSLEKVCTMLRDPKVRMHEIEVALFSPFRPMLGERGSPNNVEKLMDNKQFFIENKFDGERMQLHKKGGEYKFFSRGGNEYTQTYGSNTYEGNLVPFIDNCFKPDVKSCILDGEMVGYNPEDKTIRSKGENFDIKSINTDGYQPCFCVFDILLLNDKVLSNLPLSQRLPLIKDVFTPHEGRIIASEIKEGRTRQDCVEALNEAIDKREEGIMIKNPDSVYKPNVRKGGWFKIKPEYVGGLMDELDVLVIGGYFGVGHRGGMMSHFLCGLAVPSQSGDKPDVFYSFCRVGSGYSRKELYDFNRKLADHWQPFDKRRPPSCIVLASGLKQKPDAWIAPENSCIIQIKAAEIIQSDQFKTNYTLRFPRVEKIRSDKNWFDCMTIDELDEMRGKSEGKLTGRYAEVDESEEMPVKKKRRLAVRQERPTVAAQFRAIDTSAVTKISEMFADHEFCVVNGPSDYSKATLEEKIVEYGGSIVQHPGQETFCVIADKVAIKVKNIISKGVYDVVRADWLVRCLQQKNFSKWIPSDMIHSSPPTVAKFAEDYDRYGDSYTTDTDVDQLKAVFSKVKEQGNKVQITSSDIAEIEMKYFPDESPYGLFRTCRVYLDDKLELGNAETKIKDSSLELLALELRYFGASVTDTLDEQTSHVILDSEDLSRLAEIKIQNRKREKKFHIVTEKWVRDCLEECDLKTERYYEPAS